MEETLDLAVEGKIGMAQRVARPMLGQEQDPPPTQKAAGAAPPVVSSPVRQDAEEGSCRRVRAWARPAADRGTEGRKPPGFFKVKERYPIPSIGVKLPCGIRKIS